MSTQNFSAKIEYDPQLQNDVVYLKYNEDTIVGICPNLGSNLFKFQWQNTDLIYCDKNLLKDYNWTGCFVLWPLPNRVRNKQFEFENQIFDLREIKRNSGNYPLIHGLVDDQAWRFETPVIGPNRATLTTYIEVTEDSSIYKYFPFISRLTLKYILQDTGLKIEYSVENLSNRNLPFGFALHPYWKILANLTQTKLSLPANHLMEADSDLLPTGRIIPVEQTTYDLRHGLTIDKLILDDVFTDTIANSYSVIQHEHPQIQIQIDTSADFTHLVVYTHEKNKGFICVENQTGSTDMINLYTLAQKADDKKLEKAAHLLILPAKQTHHGFIEYNILKK